MKHKKVIGFQDVIKVLLIAYFFVRNVDLQQSRWVIRYRNFTVISDVGAIADVEYKIVQFNGEHRLSATVNMTKNVKVQRVEVSFHRCRFESYSCEYFQTWKFNNNFGSVANMKNQIWTPFFRSIKPPLEFPVIKKAFYKYENSTIDAEAAVKFYPEAAKYYWKVYLSAFDDKQRKALVMFMEVMFFRYVERNRQTDNAKND